MERRKFLGVTAFGIPVVVQGTSLYGTPSTGVSSALPSTASLLRLPLVESGMPPSLWSMVEKVGDLWHNVLTNVSANAAFRVDPTKFLADHAIPAAVMTAQDSEVRTLALLYSPNIQKALETKDYKSLIAGLREAHGLRSGRGATLRKRIVEVMQSDREKFAGIFARLRSLSTEEQLKLITGDELQYIFSVLKANSAQDLGALKGGIVDDDEDPPEDPEGMVGAVVVAVLAALVVAYVSVVVAVSVELVIGIHVSVAAMAGVIGDEEGAKHLRAEATRLAQLDPELLQDGRRAAVIAALAGSTEMAKGANAWIIESEVDAIVGAARDVGLITVSDEVAEQISRAMQQMSVRTANLSASPAG